MFSDGYNPSFDGYCPDGCPRFELREPKIEWRDGVLILDDILPDHIVDFMQFELDINANEDHRERDSRNGKNIRDRLKFHKPEYGRYVLFKLICSDFFAELTQAVNDYSYRFHAAGLTNSLEWAYGRYQRDTGMYCWHTDIHPMKQDGYRLLNFSLYLTNGEGGGLEVNNSLGVVAEQTGDFVPDESIKADFTVEQKRGRFVVMPSYYLHRVMPPLHDDREVLFGHVNIKPGNKMYQMAGA